jgi:L-alanine-DL-glutamate epimerase-like enolase superfamily enzyme
MKRIAAMAEMYSIQVAPHNPKGPIATAANLQVCATIPNFLILEHVHPTPIFDEIQVAPMKMTNGFYTPPKTPGIGIDLREEVILANPPRFRPVVQAFYADGSPAHP